MRLFQMMVCLTLVFLAISSARGQSWQQFRGPNGTGISTASNLPMTWSDQENVVWKTSLPGRGWSSPVVAGNQLWMTSAIEVKATGEERDRKIAGAAIPGLEPYSSVTLLAVCVDRETGSVVHQIELFKITDPPLIHSLNSFASPTPVIDGGRVFCHFGSFGTSAIDCESGRVLWKNQEIQLKHQTGPGSSPIIWRDHLIFHCDGTDHQFVVALDKNTGKIAWKQDRSGKMNPDVSLKKSYTTPTLLNHNGTAQLVSAAADWVYGYDPQSGKELWRAAYGRLGFSNAPYPLVGHGKIYVCTGFMRSTLIAYHFDPSNGKAGEIAWSYRNQVPAMPSPILVKNHLFMVSDRGILTCLDAETGERVYQQRLKGEFCSSPILADGRIYLGNRDGTVYVIEPAEEFKLLASNQMDSAVMATPAAVDNQLYVRTKDSLYRIQQQP